MKRRDFLAALLSMVTAPLAAAIGLKLRQRPRMLSVGPQLPTWSSVYRSRLSGLLDRPYDGPGQHYMIAAEPTADGGVRIVRVPVLIERRSLNDGWSHSGRLEHHLLDTADRRAAKYLAASQNSDSAGSAGG